MMKCMKVYMISSAKRPWEHQYLGYAFEDLVAYTNELWHPFRVIHDYILDLETSSVLQEEV